MTNAQIANHYCKLHKANLTADGVWVSDNLPSLSREGRREILAVYKKHFKYVDYNTTTGVCRCSDAPITDNPFSGRIRIGGHTGGDYGQPVNIDKLKIDSDNSTFTVVI